MYHIGFGFADLSTASSWQSLSHRWSMGKQMAMMSVAAVGVMLVSHGALNYPAYAQIADYHLQSMRVSVIDLWNIETGMRIIDDPLNRVAIPTKIDTSEIHISERERSRLVLEAMPVYPSDNRLYVPRINKNVPLITVPNHHHWQELENTIQKGLQKGVVVHPISHAPNSFGNFFVTGHSSYYAWDPGRFKDVFALLHEVEVGDLIEVYWHGRKYVYKIEGSRVVPPTEVDVLRQPHDRSIITLMTCTPIGTNTNRLIVFGTLVGSS